MSERKNDNRAREVEQNLIAVSRLNDEQLFEKYRTEPDGLNQVDAAERLEEYGRNIIDVSNENSLLSRVRDAVINPFNTFWKNIWTCWAARINGSCAMRS